MKIIETNPNTDLQHVVDNAEKGTVICLSEGVYKQKIEINTDGVTLRGQGEKTIIRYDDYAKKKDNNGVEYNTFRTYTVAVCANNVRLENLTIQNGAGNSPQKGQEVALTAYGNLVAENCVFVSEQDTLFCGPLPDDLIVRYDGFLKDKLRKKGELKQIYRNCKIFGTVDFIFGCANALFDRCKIISLNDGRKGFAAAPAHSSEQHVGFVFNECEFDCSCGVKDESIFLARPWRDYGKATFVNCTYGKHISAEGFDKWNDTDRDKTARFAEYGVICGKRVRWSKKATRAETDALLDYFQ